MKCLSRRIINERGFTREPSSLRELKELRRQRAFLGSRATLRHPALSVQFRMPGTLLLLHFQEVNTKVTISSYVRVPQNNEAAMRIAVNRQPISVSIEADDNLQFYSGGVYTGPCGTQVNHAVTVVGYGVTKARRPYWIVKNSWGPDWGENGYVRFLRNHKNKIGLCAIASDVSYPVI